MDTLKLSQVDLLFNDITSIVYKEIEKSYTDFINSSEVKNAIENIKKSDTYLEFEKEEKESLNEMIKVVNLLDSISHFKIFNQKYIGIRSNSCYSDIIGLNKNEDVNKKIKELEKIVEQKLKQFINEEIRTSFSIHSRDCWTWDCKLTNKIKAILITLGMDSYENIVSTVLDKLGDLSQFYTNNTTINEVTDGKGILNCIECSE